MIMKNNDRTFKAEYLIEAIFYNRGMIKLITIGIFSILFAPPESKNDLMWEPYGMLYATLIGIGISGVFCWIFAFKLFNRKFGIYYNMWLICFSFQIGFYLYAATQAVSQHHEMISLEGIITGLILPLITVETFLNFRYKSLLLCRICTK